MKNKSPLYVKSNRAQLWKTQLTRLFFLKFIINEWFYYCLVNWFNGVEGFLGNCAKLKGLDFSNWIIVCSLDSPLNISTDKRNMYRHHPYHIFYPHPHLYFLNWTLRCLESISIRLLIWYYKYIFEDSIWILSSLRCKIIKNVILFL